MMLVKGADLATVSSSLWHTTIAMTEAYVHAERGHKQVAGEILGSLYRKPMGEEGPDFAEKVSDFLPEEDQKKWQVNA